MISAGFTEFRRHIAAFFDKVEDGETVVVTRHGRAVAEVIPSSGTREGKSWKRPALRLQLKGIHLSRAILSDRKAHRS